MNPTKMSLMIDNFLGGPPKEAAILPEGYYTIQGNTVVLNQGPFKSVIFKIGGALTKDNLTSTPQLLYDYTILDSAGFNKRTLQSDRKLQKIISAIIVDTFLYKGLSEIGNLESEEWPNPESKQSSLET